MAKSEQKTQAEKKNKITETHRYKDLKTRKIIKPLQKPQNVTNLSKFRF